ncbi:MAG TPA: elongation factor P [Alphaproteobacteria bacterium]|jgi:elongation factor P|nr:elongation factor P [Alphaproteobacteria bacterium]
MKVAAITVRAGNVLEEGGKLWVVLKSEIFNPGKGASVVQVEMRDLKSGNKNNVRYRTQETVERVSLDEQEYAFLFSEGDSFTFMNQETFDQMTVDREVIGYPAAFLQDGMVCSIKTYEGSPLAVSIPDTVILEITEADAVVKGQTASSSYKPAVLSNGVKTSVPPFIASGTRIVVKTEDGSYVERAKD